MTDINKIDTQMVFLGVISKRSSKGNDYNLAKFSNDSTLDIFEFFISDSEVAEKLKKIPPYKPAQIVLKISSFQGNTRVDLKDVIIPKGWEKSA